MSTTVHLFTNNTKLRTGGSQRGPDNVVKKIPAGNYEALYQSAGQDVSEGGAANFWWVKIRAGSDEGWVSGVLPTEIFDFDVRPGKGGPHQVDPGAGVPRASF